jgi:hypothetical protein
LHPKLLREDIKLLFTELKSKTGDQFFNDFEFAVSGNRKLLLSTLNAPEFVRAGETIFSTFLLKTTETLKKI